MGEDTVTTRKLSAPGLALLLTTAVLAGCLAPDEDPVQPPEDNDEPQTYTVGTDAAFPPFEFLENGEFRGFDIDVMEEIAARNNWRIEWQNVGFDVLIPSVQQGEVDMAISAITITDERAEQVDFSIGYYEADQSIMVHAGEGENWESLDDLRGENLRFGVQAGTTAIAIVEEEFVDQDDGSIHRYDTYPLALSALRAGDVDVVMMDAPAQREAAGEDDEVEVAFEFPSGEIYGIAVEPGREQLLDAVNDALLEMRDDGTLDDLEEAWGLRGES